MKLQIRYAMQEQTAQENARNLLGSMSEERGRRETETGNDIGLVNFNCIYANLHITKSNWINSNALRNDLNHPNEFIRGSTLRVVAKIKEAELLEPLVPTIRECLVREEHSRNQNMIIFISSIRHIGTLM